MRFSKIASPCSWAPTSLRATAFCSAANRDGDTWASHLLDLQKRDFAPQATVADFGKGIRAGQKLALPGIPCRGDVFHALQEILKAIGYLENRAYTTITTSDKLEQERTKMH